MDGCNGARVRINSFALVAYLPEPLAGFLDELRCELAPDCRAKAHVTVLGPRPLTCRPEVAVAEILAWAQDFEPFRLDLTTVEIFPVSNVIYLAVGQGSRDMERMHAAENQGHLAFEEPFPYHPHVTLAQELSVKESHEAARFAADRWRTFEHSRSVVVDHLTFVQNTLGNRWQDWRITPCTHVSTITRCDKREAARTISSIEHLNLARLHGFGLARTPERASDHPQHLNILKRSARHKIPMILKGWIGRSQRDASTRAASGYSAAPLQASQRRGTGAAPIGRALSGESQNCDDSARFRLSRSRGQKRPALCRNREP